METVLYLSSNLLHTYGFYILFSLILGKSRFKTYVEVLTFLGHYAINSIGYMLFDNLIINLCTNIIPLLIISFQYEKHLGYKLFATFSACALGMFVDLLTFSVLPSDSVLVKNNVVQVVVYLILVFVLKYFIKNKSTDLKSNHIWFIVLISLGTITIGQLTIDKFDIRSMIISIVLMFINFLNFYMYDKDLKNLQMQHTVKLIEAANRAYQNQLKIMNESQKKIRFLKHDMKNHMYKIEKLIDEGECDKATAYINEMTESINIDNEYVNTGNNDVDCLLNYKLSIAKEIGVGFSCDISLPEELVVTSFDMTTILGNLLDNSLNALRKVDNKQLVISIKYFKGTIKINIENTYKKESDENKIRKNDEEHGLGLLSVERTLKKYHGLLDKRHTDTRYYVNAFMYNSLS